MSKQTKHGTIAAARRHERRSEPLCEACQVARSEHNAEMYRRRRRNQTETPGVVALLPLDMVEAPAPWEPWDALNVPAWTAWRPVLLQDEIEAPSLRRTVVEWTPIHPADGDAIDELVAQWHADTPGVGDRVAKASPAVYTAVLRKLGYADRIGNVRFPIPSGNRWPKPDPVVVPDGVELPEDPEWPWPLRRTETVQAFWVESGAVETDTGWVKPLPPQSRIVRAPAGTPIPEKWESPEASTLGAQLAFAAPWRVRGVTDALEAWMAGRNTATTVVVISPRGDAFEAYLGVGGQAESIGTYPTRDAAESAGREQMDERRVDVEWTDPAPVQVLDLPSPGWEAVHSVLDGNGPG